MKAFFSKYKWIIAAVAVAVIVLVAAFLSGGNVEEAAKQARQRKSAVPTATFDSVEGTSSPASEVCSTAASQTDVTATQAALTDNTINTDSASTSEEPSAPSDAALTEPKTVTTAPVTPTERPTSLPTSVPESTTAPEEPTKAKTKAPACRLSISCATVLDNMDKLDEDYRDIVPEDGWILPPTTVTIRSGDTVFDVLQRVCRRNSIHMEYNSNPVYQTAYIEGIGNLYEFDCGDNSGWMYCVNGVYPGFGCSDYTVGDGDVIEWKYTCNLGYDIGGGAQ